MAKKAIFDIHIEANGPMVHLKGETGEVLMVLFKGSVKSDLFNGIVEPCGVDTQIVNAANVRHMSARYCLEGTDNTGEPCIIYVDNHGYFTDGDTPHPFKTVPELLTNSKALAPYLHRKAFVGEGSAAPEGVTIRIFELAEE